MARFRPARGTGRKRTKPLYVIAAEGRVTERIYFESFEPGRNGGFRIDWVSNPKDRSHPLEVVKRLIQAERDRRGVETRAEYWAVIDRDSWDEADLSKAWAQIKERGNFHLALSRPCFELWLYLHLRENRPFCDRQECVRVLTEVCPTYEKSRYDPALFLGGLADAIRRARSLDERPEEAWPSQQGSRVYRLAEKLC